MIEALACLNPSNGIIRTGINGKQQLQQQLLLQQLRHPMTTGMLRTVADQQS